MGKILLKNKEDIVGTKIGKIVVLRWLRHETKQGKSKYPSSKHVYECQCECGTITEVYRPNLINHHTISCGCFNSQKNNSHFLWQGHGEISKRLWTDIQTKAKSRNIKFFITIEQAWEKFLFQERKCALSGVELKFSIAERLRLNDRTASLDRIDSSKNYTIDNIQWIDKRINKMKMNMDENEFIQICIKIAKNKGY